MGEAYLTCYPLTDAGKPEMYSLSVSFTSTHGDSWREAERYTCKKSGYTLCKITLTSVIEYYSRSDGWSVDNAVSQGAIWTLSPGNYVVIPTSARDSRQRFRFLADGTAFVVEETNTFSGGTYSEGFRETLLLEFS